MLAISGVLSANGQVAVKTNLIYDAMTTPNLGIEVGVAGKSTLNLVYGTHGLFRAVTTTAKPNIGL